MEICLYSTWHITGSHTFSNEPNFFKNEKVLREKGSQSLVEKLSFMIILCHFGHIIPNTSCQLERVIPNIHVTLTFFVILDSVTNDHIFY